MAWGLFISVVLTLLTVADIDEPADEKDVMFSLFNVDVIPLAAFGLEFGCLALTVL